MNNGSFKMLTKDNKPGIIFFSVFILLLLRLVFIPLFGLMPQDAYYYFYSTHPALSYFDHPPGIAFVLKLFTTVFGKKVAVLKLADSVVTFFTIVSFYRLSTYFLNGKNVQTAFLLFFSTAMVSVLSLVSSPDTPLILFWTLSLIGLYKAVFLDKKIYWVWSGILMGLAFDSKYTALFLPFGIVLFLLLSNKYRKQLLSPWFWSAPLFFLITISPVIIWNVQNSFASFRFQSSSRVASMSAKGIHIDFFLGVLAHQSGILMPILFFALIFFLVKGIKKIRLTYFNENPLRLFLLCFFVPLFAGFLAISFIYWVKLNWIMPAYIAGIIWVSTYFNTKWVRYQLLFSVVIHILVAVEVLFYVVPVRSDDTWFGWNDLAKQVELLKAKHPDAFIFSADDYKTSAVLNFYINEMIYAQNVVGQNALQFDFIGTDLNQLNGKEALFIDSNPMFDNEQKENKIPPSLSGYFDRITELDPILIKNGDKVVRKFLVYDCINYHSKIIAKQ
jgi:4-amino-4-deoxy-L-arabinose transferase-like glycosyltransferase